MNVARNEKRKKTTWICILYKYSKRSISSEFNLELKLEVWAYENCFTFSKICSIILKVWCPYGLLGEYYISELSQQGPNFDGIPK